MRTRARFYDGEMPEIQLNSMQAHEVSRGVMTLCERNVIMSISIGNQKEFCVVGAQGTERFREGCVGGGPGSGSCHMKDFVLYLEGWDGPRWI